MTHDILAVAVIALITAALRFLPFLVFRGDKKTPAPILRLGAVLPCAIMGTLVVYCLKNVSVVSAPFGIPELAASAAVVLLHLWRRNTLLSITGGTVLYMLLVQFVFPL